MDPGPITVVICCGGPISDVFGAFIGETLTNIRNLASEANRVVAGTFNVTFPTVDTNAVPFPAGLGLGGGLLQVAEGAQTLHDAIPFVLHDLAAANPMTSAGRYRIAAYWIIDENIATPTADSAMEVVKYPDTAVLVSRAMQTKYAGLFSGRMRVIWGGATPTDPTGAALGILGVLSEGAGAAISGGEMLHGLHETDEKIREVINLNSPANADAVRNMVEQYTYFYTSSCGVSISC